jgi:Mrp family chromosome partitioning ATPase
MSFPPRVVDPIRYMIARISRNAPFPERLTMMASLRQEGVTYLSRALATTMATDLEARICVVELNWWWPSDSFEAPGLAAVLSGEVTLKEAIVPTGLSNLSLLPAGHSGVEKRSIFAHSLALQEVIEQLNQEYDHLILDLPAVRASTDAIPLSSLGTAACLVVRQGVTPIEDIRLALDDLDHLSILGVMMNQVHLNTPSFLLKYIPQS